MYNIMKYLIVGGGISGLYCAYLLHKKLKTDDIQIIEKEEYAGGRILTLKTKETTLELGAGVILNHHKNVLKLIHELGLTNIE
jgi:protoporphyrinogen oxidase